MTLRLLLLSVNVQALGFPLQAAFWQEEWRRTPCRVRAHGLSVSSGEREPGAIPSTSEDLVTETFSITSALRWQRETWASCDCEHAACQQQSLLLFMRLLRTFLRNKTLLRSMITQIIAVARGSWQAGQQPFPGTCLPVAHFVPTRSMSRNPGCSWGGE